MSARSKVVCIIGPSGSGKSTLLRCLNGLVEVEVIAQVTSRLVVNRAALKTRPIQVGGWLEKFTTAVEAANAAKSKKAAS